MPDGAAGSPTRPAVFTIPTHRSFADSLVHGLIARFGGDALGLARGRILLPNNRAVRSVTEAFVRASGSGLVLPRLIPIGDPELDERVGGPLDPADDPEPVPRAVEPLQRLAALASVLRSTGEPVAESFRLAADLGRTIDAMLVEEIDPARLANAAGDAPDLAAHWQLSLARLQAIYKHWPAILAESGRIDLADRRNRLLRRLADRWRNSPPAGFTVAAGINTAAPAIARLLRTISELPEGVVVLAGLSAPLVMPDEEWQSLASEEGGAEETHPQYHLKLLLDRMGVAREEVQPWRQSGRRSASPAARSRAVANAMRSAQYTSSWEGLRSVERRLGGVRLAELPTAAAEAQAIALALREAVEVPGRTAALITPDRMLAERVSALLRRWGIEADDSAGKPLSRLAAGTLLLAIAAAAAEELAPVPLLALLKHPLVGGEGEARLAWLDSARILDLGLRGPRPAGGLRGLDEHVRASSKDFPQLAAAWAAMRGRLTRLERLLSEPLPLPDFAAALAECAGALAGDSAWRGADGRQSAELLSELQSLDRSEQLLVRAEDAVPLLRQLLDQRAVRPPFGGHPRIFIWGLLEGRLQQADLMILGGLNEGTWPALPAPDPWLAPKIRANLELPGLEFRIGLAAHDFASALGAPQVLITRARRDGRSPTIASRFWLRLQAMTGGLPRDLALERLALGLDEAGKPAPVDQPKPSPPVEQRPRRISVTSVDRLKADPFAFYAQAMLKLRRLDPVDADHTAAWKGIAVHEALQQWLQQDECDPARLRPRAERLLADEAIHPMLRALWAPRLLEAIDWIAAMERDNRAHGRKPLKAEVRGEAAVAGITVHGRADRIDRLPDGSLAIIDYKSGAPPTQKAVNAGFALQLGLLGLIGRAGGFDEAPGDPTAFEYWSLTRHKGSFGRLMCPDKDMAPGEFLEHAYANFAEAVHKWLTGSEPFTAKLNPAYAPYGDYDQLMRLEEWYGRR